MDSSRLSQTAYEASESKPSPSHLDHFKSKNIDPKSTSLKGIQASVQDPWSLKTPEKPTQLPRRIRNRGAVAFSVNQVKEFAQGLRTSHIEGLSDRQDQSRSNANVSSVESQKRPESSSGLVGKSSKSSEGSTKLPQKYELLGEFFDSMESSIRLLQLKGSMSTFMNICSKIESLTDRRFSYAHLAQIKYILPEAILIKKILLQDERTLCMKPELQVTLQSNAFKNDKKQKKGTRYFSLRKVFRERILDFFKAHPEGNEIPGETLPEPFNQAKQVLSSTVTACKPSLPNETSSNALPHPTAVASHLSKSFQKRFSQKVLPKLSDDIPKPSALPPSNPCPKESSSNEETLTSVAPSSLGCSSKSTNKILSRFYASPSTVAQCKETEPMNSEDFSSSEIAGTQGTPAKLTSTPIKLMSITPVSQTPKRCRMSPDDDSNTPNKLTRRPSRTRSLKFDTPVKNEKPDDELNVMERAIVDTDIIDILPEALLKSIREKERKAMVQQDARVSQANQRQQMIACLPKLFDMILLIFQSINRSVMTKEELMHKIIASHFDIIDRREAEEQLKLLEELIPDWISRKVACSGDYLIRVNKNASPELIRSKLAEAE
ncbi:CDT1-like protein a, chloroplastic isoform X1 [Telopea speciosissima]|uniref:CDT1-like protein a, chloroplastic isoform X1 n=1 Tax=Telopea speciosissima TaxID=54955 RepID=UPI001CC77B29|nr:CDT1-like protein a, chloroplastic isoform X1 [Telopea speciosissima]